MREYRATERDCPECFSMSHVFLQAERSTFNFSLPSILKQKRHHEEIEVTGNKRKKARIENPGNDATHNNNMNDCVILAEWKLTAEEE